MATYSSYKRISSEQIVDGAITEAILQPGAGNQYGILWVYSPRALVCQACSSAGGCVCQACGFCCLWTVPDHVSNATFEIWSGGGGGPGHTCSNCCSFAMGGSGGNYAIRTIATAPGCTYTICAGGTWPCSKSHTCTASMGCRSYVNGFNLSNFCVTGGCGGHMCNGDAWGNRVFGTGCANCNVCGYFNADFGVMGTAGGRNGSSSCRCHGQTGTTGIAPFIGKMHMTAATEAWCACGCHVSWPAGGGEPGQSNYCGDPAKCCAGGGQGGSGIVKVTFS